MGAGQTNLFEAGQASKSYVNLSSKVATSSSTTFSITIAAQSADWELINVRLTPKNAQLLPVELSKFNASCHNNSIIFNWSTLSELNNNYFTIEKSEDCIQFTPMAQIMGNGNSRTQIDYTYIEELYVDKFLYYRLKQTDFNGDTKIYSPITINCKSNFKKIEIFPNPNNGIFSVYFPKNNNSIEIINSAGQIVFKKEVNENKIQLNLEHLTAGIYRLINTCESEQQSVNFKIE